MLVRISDWLKRHRVIAFFILAYAIAWLGWWLEAAGIQWGAFPGYFGPAIAAILVAAITSGKAGLEELLARLFRWRVPFKWYLAAALLPAGSVLVVVAFLTLTGSTAAEFDPGRLSSILPQLAFMLVVGSLYGVFVTSGEELGWRGYALPWLLERHSAFAASIVVGIFWWLWHLPVGILFSDGASFSAADALLYGLGVNSASLIYTWMFRHTRGSVLIASLFHSVFDMSLVTAWQTAQATPALVYSARAYMLALGVIAALIVIHARSEFFSREPAWSGMQTPMPGGAR